MGNQQSTSEAISSTVNNAVSNVMLSNSSSCGQNNSATQNLSFSNINVGPGCNPNFSGISQQNYQAPNFSCFSGSNQSSSLQTALKAALQQAVKSETGGIGGALNSNSNSKTISNIINNIQSNVSVANTASCVQSNLASQEQIYNTIASSCPAVCNNPNATPAQIALFPKICSVNFNNINQTLNQTATAKCLSENTSLTSAINNAAAEVSQIATSANTGFDPLKDLAAILGSTTDAYMALIAAICCLILLPSILSSLCMMTEGGQQVTSAAAGQMKNYST